MTERIRHQYMKGIFALGLALGLSTIYLPASANEQANKEDRVLRFDIEESNYNEIKELSTQRLQQHFSKAVELLESNNLADARNHVHVSREVVGALRTLSPYMDLMNLMAAVRGDYDNSRHDLLVKDFKLMNKKVNEIKFYMPELAEQLLNQLNDLQKDAQKGNRDDLHLKLDKVSALMAENTEYNALECIDNNIQSMEMMLTENAIPVEDLSSVIKNTKELLQQIKS